MIRLTERNGKAHYLAPQNIARVSETDVRLQRHGIRALVRTTDGITIEASDRPDEIVSRIAAFTSLQAEIAGHEAANGHLSALVDELRELLQDAKHAMTELHQAAVPDESTEGVPAIISPEAFRKFTDAHAQLCFLLHQRGHNPPKEGLRNG